MLVEQNEYNNSSTIATDCKNNPFWCYSFRPKDQEATTCRNQKHNSNAVCQFLSSRDLLSIEKEFHRMIPSGIHKNPVLSEFEKKMILLSESSKEDNSCPEPPSNQGRPTEEQLHRIHTGLATSVGNLCVCVRARTRERE